MTLRQRKFKHQLRAFARGIPDGPHLSPVNTLSYPYTNRVQTIEHLDRSETMYDRTYLHVERIDDVLLVHVIPVH